VSTTPAQAVETLSPGALTMPAPARSQEPVERDPPPSRERVLEVVTRLSGNIRRTAEELGRSRKQVYRYLEHYGIDLEALRKSQS
jgi:DNA-binding NtrC family response regulator